jgi:hypothetical protein
MIVEHGRADRGGSVRTVAVRPKRVCSPCHASGRRHHAPAHRRERRDASNDRPPAHAAEETPRDVGTADVRVLIVDDGKTGLGAETLQTALGTFETS